MTHFLRPFAVRPTAASGRSVYSRTAPKMANKSNPAMPSRQNLAATGDRTFSEDFVLDTIRSGFQ